MAAELSRDEILKAVDQMLPELQKMMANMTGSKVRAKIDEDAKAHLVDLIASLQKWQDIDLSKMDVAERKQKFLELSDLLKGALKVRGEENILEILIADTASSLEISNKDRYLHDTDFAAYKDALLKIVEKMFSANKVEDVRKYFSTMPIEDHYSFSQNAVRLEKHMPFLRKGHRRMTKQVVEKNIAVYRDLSTIMEMLVRQLIAVRKILDGEAVDYLKIKNENLANLLGTLSKTPLFSKLVAPFDITVRNAIAHGSTALEPMSESIRFTDRKKAFEIKYVDFLNQTRELAAAIIVIMNLSTAISLRAFQIAKSNLAQQV